VTTRHRPAVAGNRYRAPMDLARCGAVVAAALAASAVVGLAPPATARVAATAAAAPAPLTRTAAPYRDRVRFTVRYRGSGHVDTIYAAKPPNPGGKHDTNAVHDTSTQAWRITYISGFTVGPCGVGGTGTDDVDPCATVGDILRARGTTSATGTVRHTHVDGLYRQLDSEAHCHLAARTPRGFSLSSAIAVRYAPAMQAFALTAGEPVTDALSLLPGACPSQEDSLDLILDNYFAPGFSFDQAYTSARWFTAATVVVPTAILHTSAEIRIPLADTRAGTPPRHCAVRHPSYERCTTRGAWSGTLTLTASNP
jgi:hypothetical protein